MQYPNFNIEPKPVETIPVSSLMEEAKKKLDAIPEVKIEELRAEANKIKSKFAASDWLNVIKGLGQQKALQAMGFEPNTNISLKTVAIVTVVIGLIIAAIKIFG